MGPQWQLQTAKNRLSELVDTALRQGPQTITRRGKPAVVVISTRDYRRIRGERLKMSEFFARSPLRGRRLDLARARDLGRDVEL